MLFPGDDDPSPASAIQEVLIKYVDERCSVKNRSRHQSFFNNPSCLDYCLESYTIYQNKSDWQGAEAQARYACKRCEQRRQPCVVLGDTQSRVLLPLRPELRSGDLDPDEENFWVLGD